MDQKQTYFNIAKLTEAIQQNVFNAKETTPKDVQIAMLMTNLAIAQQLSVISARLGKVVNVAEEEKPESAPDSKPDGWEKF